VMSQVEFGLHQAVANCCFTRTMRHPSANDGLSCLRNTRWRVWNIAKRRRHRAQATC